MIKKIILFTLMLITLSYICGIVFLPVVSVIDGNKFLYNFVPIKYLIPIFPAITILILLIGTLAMWILWVKKIRWHKKLTLIFTVFTITFVGVGYFNPSVFLLSRIIPLYPYTFLLGERYEETTFSSHFSWKNFLKVETGMTRNQMIDILGRPLDIYKDTYFFSKQADPVMDYWVVKVATKNDKVQNSEVYYWID